MRSSIPERVAIWGWSGGGTSTLNAMFRFPDVFKVGVAVAPVPDQRLYDTIYQERYMGLPQENAEGYRLGSPINFAEGLKGRLLIVHGSGDDNVHYQGTERLVNRLVSLGKPFDLMVYPNRSHAISEGEGTTLHVYSLIARYLVEHALVIDSHPARRASRCCGWRTARPTRSMSSSATRSPRSWTSARGRTRARSS